MKKLMFASALAAGFAAFGELDGLINATGFEGLNAGVGEIGLLNDNGQTTAASTTGFNFWYQSKDSSTDGSTVKSYGTSEDNLPTFDYLGLLPQPFVATGETPLANNNYLELSTEGGTLWRSPVSTASATELPSLDMFTQTKNAQVWVDTMVQFTPTEDGGAPATEAADKLAIWLNVDSTNEAAPVTNLCVKAAYIDQSGVVTPTTYVLKNAPEVVPGKWYRLTVKAVADILGFCEVSNYSAPGLPGFVIYVDGTLMKTEGMTMTGELFALYEDYMDEETWEGIQDGSVFASLAGLTSTPVFQGVGFKGSGAIDDLVLTEDDPNFFGVASSIDFTLALGEGVSAVSYTIGSETKSITETTELKGVAVGMTVTIGDVTYADWYVAATGNPTTITPESGKTYTIAGTLAATPADANATGLTGVETAYAKAWADAKGLTPTQIRDCDFALDAYLMNTDLSAAPGLEITSITEVEGGWQITVKGTQGDKSVTLAGIRGELQVKAAAALTGLATAEAQKFTVTLDDAGVAKVTVPGTAGNFMKATVGLPAPVVEE